MVTSISLQFYLHSISNTEANWMNLKGLAVGLISILPQINMGGSAESLACHAPVPLPASYDTAIFIVYMR